MKYIFTDKKNPKWGIMSSILGVISLTSVYLAIYFTYANKGIALMQYGVAVLLAIIYAIVGVVLGVRSILEKDIFMLFPILGIVINSLTLIVGGIIVYLGI